MMSFLYKVGYKNKNHPTPNHSKSVSSKQANKITTYHPKNPNQTTASAKTPNTNKQTTPKRLMHVPGVTRNHCVPKIPIDFFIRLSEYLLSRSPSTPVFLVNIAQVIMLTAPWLFIYFLYLIEWT